jgi:ornithine cyclodeaminase
VGFAIEDFSVLRLLRDLARETGSGREIELIATPVDPKDLFSLLRLAQAPQENRFEAVDVQT